ncbi:lipopolysaccharide biosynthesis protein [Winogradskyella thalassocola]|uniref:Polysaccharide biosynthesis protein n=1 Tax=Winogradskyella thalassocola TaxID=262004 RepID=A0A1G7WSW4_9FLAO|nr:oligosaccharide flippase family protein [Winogradskyella thalassocola]SDG75031.1 Polysaccharide biosynthesis protein [Winogradskyella thalassocola]
MINAIKKHAAFGVIFTIAKALVYFTPLILADVLSTSDYGILEYALAGVGVIVNTLINLGVPGAYPYFVIREKKEKLKSGFNLHPIILLIPFVINQIAFLCFQLDVNFYLAFNISYIIANQVFYSTQLKSHEKSSYAVLLDSGIYIVLFLFFIGYRTGFFQSSITVINNFVLAYAFIYVIFGISRFIKSEKQHLTSHYRAILRFSIHLLVSTFLIFLITTSGRILVEFFFGFDEVGIYAFYFRLAAIVVMIHQIINIAYFKKIYTFSPLILDQYFYKFFIIITTLSLVIYFISPFVVSEFSNFFNDTFDTYKSIYFLLSAQMIMWIASALNSNIIDRENSAKVNNVFFLILISIVGFLLYIFNGKFSFTELIYIHFTSIYIACMIQYYTLSKKNIYFKKSALTLTVIFLLESGYYFLFF